MAEVYGEKPKMFSREWWPYFWDYYRWHTISAAFVLFAIIITLVQCAQKERYDITVNYVGAGYISTEKCEELEVAFEELATDIDGNGEVNVFFQQINMGADNANPELEYALQTKHDIGLTEDTSHLYIYSKAQAEVMLGRDIADDTYASVDEWFEGEIDDSMVVRSKTGQPLAICLKNSEFMKEHGVVSDDMYAAIKLCNGKNEVNEASYNSAVEIAQAMMK